MPNLNFLLLGVFAAIASPFAALLLSTQGQLGELGRAIGEESGPLSPALETGLAIQGRSVYLSLGCVSCHTQQVRPAGQGSDIARGYGQRPSVARDYSLQPLVLLGERRLGPDLANYGARTPRNDLVALLTDPASSGAVWHPAYRFVDSASLTALVAYLTTLRQDYASPEAQLKK